MDTVSTGCQLGSCKEESGETRPEISQGDQQGGEDVHRGDRT